MTTNEHTDGFTVNAERMSTPPETAKLIAGELCRFSSHAARTACPECEPTRICWGCRLDLEEDQRQAEMAAQSATSPIHRARLLTGVAPQPLGLQGLIREKASES